MLADFFELDGQVDFDAFGGDDFEGEAADEDFKRDLTGLFKRLCERVGNEFISR